MTRRALPYTSTMIRVIFEDREPEDVPGNHAAVGGAGELMISHVEFGLVRNSQPPFQEVPVITASEWLKIFSRATGWLTAEPATGESTDGIEATTVSPESAVEVEAEPVIPESAALEVSAHGHR